MKKISFFIIIHNNNNNNKNLVDASEIVIRGISSCCRRFRLYSSNRANFASDIVCAFRVGICLFKKKKEKKKGVKKENEGVTLLVYFMWYHFPPDDSNNYTIKLTSA